MFDAARAAGLPMLGGVDIFVPSASGVVRAHYWPAGRPLLNPHDEPHKATKLRSESKKKRCRYHRDFARIYRIL